MEKPSPFDIDRCPNPQCTRNAWHGIPVGTDEERAQYSPDRWDIPVFCPGSHLFNDDGTAKDGAS